MIGLLTFGALLVAVFAVPEHLNTLQWNQFKLDHNKAYDAKEEALRFATFCDNLKKIEEHNALYDAGKVTYQMGVTKFADMTEEEFLNYLTLSGPKPTTDDTADVFQPPVGVKLPESIDYRKKNAVNPVKDQKSCGSCWAFSTIGSLEGINSMKTGKLLSLSEQNLVDCSNSYGNHGCGGGLMRLAYNYIKDNGIETEKDYPYVGRNQQCMFNNSQSVLKVTGFTKIKVGSEDDLQAAVATQGPIAIAVDARGWQMYKSGIFKSISPYVWLNHGVVAIGYGVEKGVDYWIVRNSWGPAWGEKGYIRVARNDKNTAGISNDACFPNL